MSPKLPSVNARSLAGVARRLGFVLKRQTGSHAVYFRPGDNAMVVIPVHGGRDVDPEVVRAIVRDLGITADEFQALL